MEINNMEKEFIHYKIDDPIRAIGGEYTLTKEVRMPFEGEELLYITGYAVLDTSCCGSGGCGYAIVPGIIKKWKIEQNEDNRPVSIVKPIQNPEARKRIQDIIKKIEMVQEVRFE